MVTDKKQPWFHSWYGDILGFQLVPLLFVLLALFKLPPFGEYKFSSAWVIVSWILVFDWAHNFAQWYRIYGNPVESKKMKIFAPASFLLLIPAMFFIVRLDYRFFVQMFLVYFVIYHMLRQQYGYIRIYAKADGRKPSIESFTESFFIYASMVTPLIYWHTTLPYKPFGWVKFFIQSPIIQNAIYPALICYLISGVFFLFFEIRRSKKNNFINIPKNLSILAGVLGWGLISILVDSPLLIYFTVILTHGLSYIAIVWLVGRRDRRITQEEISWASWWSVPGLFSYVFILLLVSQGILLIYQRLVGDATPNMIFGMMMEPVLQNNRFWSDLGFAILFSIQGHHYFVDRYLWKKEKDLSYVSKL